MSWRVFSRNQYICWVQKVDIQFLISLLFNTIYTYITGCVSLMWELELHRNTVQYMLTNIVCKKVVVRYKKIDEWNNPPFFFFFYIHGISTVLFYDLCIILSHFSYLYHMDNNSNISLSVNIIHEEWHGGERGLDSWTN